MDTNTLLQHLHNTLLPDGNIRMGAESFIKSFIQNSYQDALGMFIQIILDVQIPLQIRQMASIIMKNSLHTKNKRIQSTYEARWLGCSADFRSRFINIISENFGWKEQSILQNLSKVYGSILRIEMANGLGTRQLEVLQDGISDPKNAVGILNALLTACDQLYEETKYEFGQEKYVVFNISTFYLNQDANMGRDILYSTLICILSCLEVFDDIMGTVPMRQQFVHKIFTCPKPDSEVLEISFEVLNRFVDVYNCVTDEEIETICQFYLSFFDNQNPEDVPLQLFDFWFIMIDLEKYAIVKQFIPRLVPHLLLCITKEDPEDAHPSPHKSSCNLLINISSKMKILLLAENMYQNFILNNLCTADFEKHAIAATGLGCICTAGSNEFLYQVLPILIEDLAHDVCVNEALFAMAKICENDISVTVNFLPTIIQKVGILIDYKSKVAINAANVYAAIIAATQTGIVDEIKSIVLFHYSDILQLLIRRLDVAISGEYELRAALNLALTDLISCCPPSNKVILDQLISHFVNQSNKLIEAVGYAVEQQHLILDDVLCNYIVLLEPCLKRKKVFETNKITDLFLQCLKLPRMLAHGEIYIVISKLLSAFSIHLKKFIPFLIRDITNPELFILKAALNLLSDCAILLESNFVEFAQNVIPELVKAIASQEVPVEIKPKIVSGLGDIALAIGKSFEPYISLCIRLLTLINTLNREGDEDYVDNLKKAAMKLFSCLFVSVGRTDEMRSGLEEIAENIRMAIESDVDNTFVKESVDVINDMKIVPDANKNVDKSWIVKFLRNVIRTNTGRTQERAREMLETFY